MSKRALATTAIFLSVSAAVAASSWIYYSSASASEKIISAKRDIAQIGRREANIKKLEDLTLSIAPEEKKISGIFAQSDNLVLFIEKLETAASDAGVSLEIESAEFATSGKPAPLDEVLPRFKIKTEGGFGQCFRFLRLLETMPFQIEINDASFSLRQGAEGGKFWQLHISITLLSFLDQ